jgi:hypothetical protein
MELLNVAEVRGHDDASAPRKLLVEGEEEDILPLLQFEEERRKTTLTRIVRFSLLMSLMGGSEGTGCRE